MSLQQNDSEMSRNFLVAMVLSMLIIFGYPVFLNWISPPAPPQEETQTEQAVEQIAQEEAGAISANVNGEGSALKPVDGPFLEKPSLPSVVRFENQWFQADFTTLGASVAGLHYKGEDTAHVETATTFFEAAPSLPGIFTVDLVHERNSLKHRIFKLIEQTENSLTFVYEKPNAYKLYKIFEFSETDPVIMLHVEVMNTSGQDRHFSIAFDYGFAVGPGGGMAGVLDESIVHADKVRSANLGKLKKKGYQFDSTYDWAGSIRRYFALLVKPGWKTVGFESTSDGEVIEGTLKMSPITVSPQTATRQQFMIYAGTQRYEFLKKMDVGFEKVLSKGFFGGFKLWLLQILKFFNGFTHNYGFAIILLTVLIKLVFAPLTHMSMRSMKKMQDIQPKIKAIQERHKNDPEKVNKETMELFKKNKVNPMAGCLPMLIQMPILLAMFRLLPEAIELKGAPFIGWITDLSVPDQLFMLPFAIPLLGWNAVNLLPIIMVFSQIAYQKTMPQATANNDQMKVMKFMPIFFGFICYNMSSGLVLYWLVQNVLSILQQKLITDKADKK